MNQQLPQVALRGSRCLFAHTLPPLGSKLPPQIGRQVTTGSSTPPHVQFRSPSQARCQTTNVPTMLARFQTRSSPQTRRHITNVSSSSPRPSTSFSRPPTPPPTRTPAQLREGPYIVRRTASIQLPVYKSLKSGGNRVVILIKKIDGDRRKLMQDMATSLGVGKEDIRINPTTQHLELKGDHYDKAKAWLVEHGF